MCLTLCFRILPFDCSPMCCPTRTRTTHANPFLLFPNFAALRSPRARPRQCARWLVNPLRLLGGRKESESKGGRDGPKQGSFGEDNQFYYDEAKKRWVMKGQVRCGAWQGGPHRASGPLVVACAGLQRAAGSAVCKGMRSGYVCALNQLARSRLVLCIVSHYVVKKLWYSVSCSCRWRCGCYWCCFH